MAVDIAKLGADEPLREHPSDAGEGYSLSGPFLVCKKMRVWQSRGRVERSTHWRAHARTSPHSGASVSGSNAAISPEASNRIWTGRNPDGPAFRSGRPKHAREMHVSAAVSTRHEAGEDGASFEGDVAVLSSEGDSLSGAAAGSLSVAAGAGAPLC